MSKLHMYSNRHIKDQVKNINTGDCIYLENRMSKSRWSLYFSVNNINEASLEVKYITQEEYMNLKNINFDAVVGNPPYNDSNNGNIPIYGDFLKKAQEVSNRVSFIIPSSFALSDERNGDEIRKMAFSPYTKKIEFLPKDTFENVDVETLSITIDMTKTHNTEIVSRNGDSYFTNSYDYIFEDKILYNILTKCNTVSNRTSYIKFNRMENSKKSENKVKTLTCINPSGKTYEETNTIDKFLGNHRVVTSFFQDPEFRHYLTYTVEPEMSVKDGYTVSLCNSENGANNLVNFIKSKLFLAIYKKTRTSRTLRTPQLKFIPKVDLSRKWTDEELYTHFRLTQEEIKYIEANVK
jgi:hypothetical protein